MAGAFFLVGGVTFEADFDGSLALAVSLAGALAGALEVSLTGALTRVFTGSFGEGSCLVSSVFATTGVGSSGSPAKSYLAALTFVQWGSENRTFEIRAFWRLVFKWFGFQMVVLTI